MRAKLATAFCVGAALSVTAGVLAQSSGLPSRPRFQQVTVTGPATALIPAITIQSINPQFEQRNSGATADNQRWNWATASNTYQLRACNDAGTVCSNAVVFGRTGSTMDTVNFTAASVQINGQRIPRIASGSFDNLGGTCNNAYGGHKQGFSATVTHPGVGRCNYTFSPAFTAIPTCVVSSNGTFSGIIATDYYDANTISVYTYTHAGALSDGSYFNIICVGI
jgi:hypothetical protein